jgi:hypothetical protein
MLYFQQIGPNLGGVRSVNLCVCVCVWMDKTRIPCIVNEESLLYILYGMCLSRIVRELKVCLLVFFCSVYCFVRYV